MKSEQETRAFGPFALTADESAVVDELRRRFGCSDGNLVRLALWKIAILNSVDMPLNCFAMKTREG